MIFEALYILRAKIFLLFAVVGMSKINKELAILIVFLILIVFAGTFMKTPVDTKTSVKS